MLQGFKGVIYFIAILIVVIVVLKVLNWLPANIQKDYIREFSSYEEVRRDLKIKNIIRPKYFPENILWPPEHIIAQKRPYVTIISEFRDKITNKIALVVIQTEGKNYYKRKDMNLVEIKEKAKYTINNTSGNLEVGLCSDSSPCSRLTLQVDKYKIMVILKAPPFELLKIAESMIQ